MSLDAPAERCRYLRIVLPSLWAVAAAATLLQRTTKSFTPAGGRFTRQAKLSTANYITRRNRIVFLIPFEVVTDALVTGAGGGASAADGSAWVEVQPLSA